MQPADLPKFWPPPRPVILRPAERELLAPRFLRPADDTRRALLFTPAVRWRVAPRVITRASFGNLAATSQPVTLPGSLAAGNLLIVAVGYRSGAGVTLTTPAGWTLLTSYTGNPYCYIFCKTSDGAEGSTLSIPMSGSGNPIGAVAYQIADWFGTPQYGTLATGTSTTADPPAVTPSGPASLALALAGAGGIASAQTVSSYPSGYVNGQIGTGGSANYGFAAGAETTTAGTASVDPGVFTFGQSSNWWAQTVIVNGA
jgi:hypothetical protein